MERLVIEETSDTPLISFDPIENDLQIKGKSYPENTFEFYEPVINWLTTYLENCQETVMVNFDLDYFNSSTSKVLFDIFDLLDEAKVRLEMEIKWYYHRENQIILEAGEDFQFEFAQLPIELIEMNE